jgi:hypothetical protein
MEDCIIVSEATKPASSGTVILPFVASPTYFQAYLSPGAIVNGNDTTFTIKFQQIISNQGSAYSSATGMFTAPVTGFYCFQSTIGIRLINTVGRTHVSLAYTGSVQSLRIYDIGSSAIFGGTDINFNSSFSIPMTAGNTVRIQPFIDGVGTYELLGVALGSAAFTSSSSFSGYQIPFI